MEYRFKETPTLYFTTYDGILIGKTKMAKFYREIYHNLEWEIKIIEPLIDIDLMETLLSAESFIIYTENIVNRASDGKKKTIWYKFINSTIDSFTQQTNCYAEENAEPITTYIATNREYITEKDLPESVKEELK